VARERSLRPETVWPSCKARMRKLRQQPPVAPRHRMVCLGWVEVDMMDLLFWALEMYLQDCCLEVWRLRVEDS
jgi:hypothetical protein